MTCDDCHLWRRCPFHGASPTEAEKGDVECVTEADGPRGELVAVPTSVTVDAKTGNVATVRVDRLLFRRSWWTRLLRRP